jgi:integrase
MRGALIKVDSGLPVPLERLTLEAHLDSWLTEKKKALRPDSWRRYNDLCRNYIIPEIGSVRLTRLRIEDVQRLHDALLQKVSGTTAQHAHGVLRNALQDALRWGRVGVNVASLVAAPSRSTGEQKALSPDDGRALLGAAKGNPLEALYILAITSGLREGELLALRWKDVDLERRRLRVTATLASIEKGMKPVFSPSSERKNHARTIWLTDLAVQALEAHKTQQDSQRELTGDRWVDYGLVFTRELGHPISKNIIYRNFKPLLARAGLNDMRFHDLRHSAATLLLDDNVPVRLVSEMLGHSDVATTLRIYAHVIQGAQEQAVSSMDRLFNA